MKKIIFSVLVFTILSCGIDQSLELSLVTENLKEFPSNGDRINLSIANPKDIKIENVKFLLNGTIVDREFFLNTKLGSNELSAIFTINDKQKRIKKKFIVYSDIEPKLYKYKIINQYDHDISSYTQGLEFDENQILFESTGQYGYSTLKKINFKNGETIKNIFLDENYFGEGITILNDKIYQLTWLKGVGFIYEKDSFKMIDSFNYNDSLEGWGLCNDGEYLYKSDGSEKIWKLDPNTLEELSNIQVVTNNKVINKINELEWVDGKIYANTYQFNKEVGIIIDPIDGSVDGVIDFSGLKQRVKKHDKLDVLNGIAYNKHTRTFFVTGKYWNKLFEIQIFEN